MSGERDIGSYLEDMIVACEHVLAVASGRSDDSLLDRSGACYGDTLHQIAVMGEAAKHVPDEVRARRPAVPWTRIAGMRDLIVHYYFGLTDAAVVSTVRESVPAILPQLHGLLTEIDSDAGR